MSALAWLLAKLGGLGAMLAARQLARMPGTYVGPLILLVLTLSLSAFTASLALTLDDHLYDQSYYAVGSDMNVFELAEDTQSSGQLHVRPRARRQNQRQTEEARRLPVRAGTSCP